MSRYGSLVEDGHFKWTPRLFGLFITRTFLDSPEWYFKWGRLSLSGRWEGKPTRQA